MFPWRPSALRARENDRCIVRGKASNSKQQSGKCENKSTTVADLKITTAAGFTATRLGGEVSPLLIGLFIGWTSRLVTTVVGWRSKPTINRAVHWLDFTASYYSSWVAKYDN